MVPSIIVNALGVHLKILDKDRHGHVNENLIVYSRTATAPTIVIQRRNNHYNGILKTNASSRQRQSEHPRISASPHQAKVDETLIARTVTYSTQSLRSLHGEHKIDRRMRKRLFALRIWKPRQNPTEQRSTRPVPGEHHHHATYQSHQ